MTFISNCWLFGCLSQMMYMAPVESVQVPVVYLDESMISVHTQDSYRKNLNNKKLYFTQSCQPARGFISYQPTILRLALYCSLTDIGFLIPIPIFGGLTVYLQIFFSLPYSRNVNSPDIYCAPFFTYLFSLCPTLLLCLQSFEHRSRLQESYRSNCVSTLFLLSVMQFSDFHLLVDKFQYRQTGLILVDCAGKLDSPKSLPPHPLHFTIIPFCWQ